MSRAVVVGAGHNGLVAATLLARAGLDVTVVEAADVVGGACRTETPFAKVPGLRQSTGAYLLGLMPPELVALLDLDLPLVRRDPHYFLPTTGERHLLLGSDVTSTRAQLERFFSAADVAAIDRLDEELSALRSDLAPAWLAAPGTVEETAERYVRAALRDAFVDLVRGSAVDYLQRFGFASDLLVAMYAVTDGVSGLAAGIDDAGSGHNLLVHNMCRLPGSDGTWMIVRGGMGTVTSTLADAVRAAGGSIRTGVAATAVTTSAGVTDGVALADGTVLPADVAVAGCDPWRLAALLPDVPAWLDSRLTRWRRPGTTLKVNMALRDLPRFTCLPNDVGQHAATMHLLPDDDDVLGAVRRAWDDARAGRLADFPTIEWYVHTGADTSLRDGDGHHSSALFVQWVPYEPAGSSWDAELDGYVAHLLSLCDRFAPGTSDLVTDVFPLTPPGIESHFGITGGHIHHVDNTFALADRMPYSVLPGLYACSAACHPAGSVIGAAGHNAAMQVLADLG